MRTLSDNDVYDRLHAALLALGNESAATVRGESTLAAARMALTAYQMALVAAMERPLPPPPY